MTRGMLAMSPGFGSQGMMMSGSQSSSTGSKRWPNGQGGLQTPVDGSGVVPAGHPSNVQVSEPVVPLALNVGRGPTHVAGQMP